MHFEIMSLSLHSERIHTQKLEKNKLNVPQISISLYF
jgi:hypothetical protein